MHLFARSRQAGQPLPRFSNACCVAALLGALAGCEQGGLQYAPVSGQVTLDGAPVEGAKVLFLPIAEPGQTQAGPSSQGTTDAEGHYTLSTVGPEARPGAVVGTHQVVLSTLITQPDPKHPASETELVITPEKIPAPYRHLRDTPLRVEVPPEGTERANFAL